MGFRLRGLFMRVTCIRIVLLYFDLCLVVFACFAYVGGDSLELLMVILFCFLGGV